MSYKCLTSVKYINIKHIIAQVNCTQMSSSVKRKCSRQKLGKYLRILPDWIFGKSPRIIINEAVLRIPQVDELRINVKKHVSVDNTFVGKNERNDSAKLINDSNDKIYFIQKATESITAVETELKLLREQINIWLNMRRTDSINFSEINPTTRNDFEEIKSIPEPPPLPTHVYDVESFKNGNVKMAKLLRDISCVKLKPITKNKNNNNGVPKECDIRNDLYAILKSRYSAMHSPGPCKSADKFEEVMPLESDSFI